jgi:Ion transport protein
LKIAYNLKELTYQKNVKKFFFARFKRRLIKKSIIDKILYKIIKYTIETELLLRASGRRIYGISYYVMSSRIFKFISLLIILANTVVLGLVHDVTSPDFDRVLEQLNLFFFGFFCFELIVKLLGEGFKYYLRDKFNWFDGTIVALSSIDIALEYGLRAKGR